MAIKGFVWGIIRYSGSVVGGLVVILIGAVVIGSSSEAQGSIVLRLGGILLGVFIMATGWKIFGLRKEARKNVISG